MIASQASKLFIKEYKTMLNFAKVFFQSK